MDPVTDRDSAVSVLRVNVVSAAEPSPSIGAVTLTLDQPAADATLTGAVPVSGTAAPAEQIQLSAVLVTAPTPTFTVTDPAGAAVKLSPVAPDAPQPASVTADATGGFSGSLSLGPGTWDVVVTPTSTEPVTRRVTVRPADGLAATLLLEGGDSYLELEQDGVPLAGVSGGISNDGERVNMSAKTTIRIRAGNAGAVRLSVNGIGLGAMGANGAVIEWRIARSGD
jgi:hypothetical protein